YMPIKNKAVLTNSICDMGTLFIRRSLPRPLVLGEPFCLPGRLIEKFAALIFGPPQVPFLSQQVLMVLSLRSRYTRPSQLIKACSLIQTATHNHRWLFQAFASQFLKRSSRNSWSWAESQSSRSVKKLSQTQTKRLMQKRKFAWVIVAAFPFRTVG